MDRGKNPSGDRQRSLFGEEFPIPEPRWVEVNAAGVRAENPRQFGGPWLALELVRWLGLDQFLERVMPRGKERIPWSLTSLILVIARWTNCCRTSGNWSDSRPLKGNARTRSVCRNANDLSDNSARISKSDSLASLVKSFGDLCKGWHRSFPVNPMTGPTCAVESASSRSRAALTNSIAPSRKDRPESPVDSDHLTGDPVVVRIQQKRDHSRDIPWFTESTQRVHLN